MTPAETLTAAADRIERVASEATLGPWEAGERCVWAGFADVVGDGAAGDAGVLDPANAEHIALWSPDVALLLVPTLRAEAARAAEVERRGIRLGERLLNDDLLALAERINNEIGDRS